MPDVDIKVDAAFVEKLRRLFRLEKEDLELVRQIRDRMLPDKEGILDKLYSHILSFPELAAVFRDDQFRQRARASQGRHLAKVLSGVIDDGYIQEGLQVGSVHEALGVEPSWYLAGYASYMESLLTLIGGGTEDVPVKEQHMLMSQALIKVMLMDIALAWEAYYRKKEQKLRDTYKVLETDHNFALAMIIKRDEEIKALLERSSPPPPLTRWEFVTPILG